MNHPNSTRHRVDWLLIQTDSHRRLNGCSLSTSPEEKHFISPTCGSVWRWVWRKGCWFHGCGSEKEGWHRGRGWARPAGRCTWPCGGLSAAPRGRCCGWRCLAGSAVGLAWWRWWCCGSMPPGSSGPLGTLQHYWGEKNHPVRFNGQKQVDSFSTADIFSTCVQLKLHSQINAAKEQSYMFLLLQWKNPSGVVTSQFPAPFKMALKLFLHGFLSQPRNNSYLPVRCRQGRKFSTRKKKNTDSHLRQEGQKQKLYPNIIKLLYEGILSGKSMCSIWS